MHRFLAVSVIAALALACASGSGGGGGGGSDSGPRTDGAVTPGDDDGGARDAGRRDSGTTPGECLDGQHMCGGGCIDDQPNEPANGCRLGCGEACPPPPGMGTATCSAEGTCDFTCTIPFRREGDACVCTPRTCEDMGAMCGAPDDGCGMQLNCGGCGSGTSCIDGRCACTPDGREPNDSRGAAPNLGDYADDDDPDLTYTDLNIDEPGDADWLAFHVVDDDTDNATITVTLDRMPANSDYDMVAFYVCDGGGENTDCTEGIEDNSIGNGCAPAANSATSERVVLQTDCDRGIDIFNTNDSGMLYVRVTARTHASCEPYRLQISIR